MLTAYKRVSNILNQIEKKQNVCFDGTGMCDNALRDSAEKDLAVQLSGPVYMACTLSGQLSKLVQISVCINRFLDESVVIVDDIKVAQTRLHLLGRVRSLFHQVLDFWCARRLGTPVSTISWEMDEDFFIGRWL